MLFALGFGTELITRCSGRVGIQCYTVGVSVKGSRSSEVAKGRKR